jgi:hypothetical protein
MSASPPHPWFTSILLLASAACSSGPHSIPAAEPSIAKGAVNEPAPESDTSAPSHVEPASPEALARPRIAANSAKLAEAWLRALKDGDVEQLARLSHYPLELRDTGGEGNCEAKRSVTSARALPPAVACLTGDDLLRRAMREDREARVVPLLRTQWPHWAKPWWSEVGTDAAAFSLYIGRDDSAFEVVVVIAEASVIAVWKDGTDAVAEVALAKRWLDALRRRDANAIASTTAYPFELRETETRGPCGRLRRAQDPRSLSAALKCLMADDAVHGALEQSRDSAVRASVARDDVPNWAQAWWRADVHAGLWPVSVILATEACCEYDFTLLVGQSGVRALWKTGSIQAADEDFDR